MTFINLPAAATIEAFLDTAQARADAHGMRVVAVRGYRDVDGVRGVVVLDEKCVDTNATM